MHKQFGSTTTRCAILNPHNLITSRISHNVQITPHCKPCQCECARRNTNGAKQTRSTVCTHTQPATAKNTIDRNTHHISEVRTHESAQAKPITSNQHECWPNSAHQGKQTKMELQLRTNSSRTIMHGSLHPHSTLATNK